MSRPDVSVLFPVRHAHVKYPPELFETAVLSTLRQPGVSLEVCFVDNASTDGTWETLQALAEDHRNIKITRNQRDEGAAYSLNCAAEMAEGRFFIFQSARSWYARGALAVMAAALDRADGYGFAYGQTEYRGAIQKQHVPPLFQRERFWHSFDSLFGYMYRRDAWDAGCRYEWYIERAEGRIDLLDWDFAMQLIVKMGWSGLALSYLPALIYFYSGTGQMTELVHKYQAVLDAEFARRWGAR
jgi:glycosyltransferase involved in cell wall biosynthesis